LATEISEMAALGFSPFKMREGLRCPFWVKPGNDTRGPERPDPKVLPSLETGAPADVRDALGTCQAGALPYGSVSPKKTFGHPRNCGGGHHVTG
jgi:hypothetical protein